MSQREAVHILFRVTGCMSHTIGESSAVARISTTGRNVESVQIKVMNTQPVQVEMMGPVCHPDPIYCLMDFAVGDGDISGPGHPDTGVPVPDLQTFQFCP
jgi:hypothetical protein